MNILIPTDFSTPSAVAALYGMQLAKSLKGSVTLVWFNSIQTSKKSLAKWKLLEKEMKALAEEDAAHLMADLKAEVRQGPTLTYAPITGTNFANALEAYAKKENFDLIVMGTKGATGMKKVLVGSNATAVIDNSSIPVLVVPETCEYKPFKRIVYASDLKKLEAEAKTMAKLAATFKAELHVLHVANALANTKQAKSLLPELVKACGYSKIVFKELVDENIASAIDRYLNEVEADLLSMFTHKLDFYEKLFGKSVTREMAFHSAVPLLAFNKTNEG
ncbi:MAG: universal stress protein [Cyclobacteriaceae bacterium]|jgi:nucleotide-binding universal stress UspA family protein|nr:universal stress protein [Cyclobacteriaceae bacterium]